MGDSKKSASATVERYSDAEIKRRFEAALRGARKVGHTPMKQISPKRKGKRKAIASA